MKDLRQHPMKPTEDQIRKWARFDCTDLTPQGLWRRIAHAAYAAGADAELEECCQHIRNHQYGFVRNPDRTFTHRAVDLLWARRPESRPKPPLSLAEQGLDALRNTVFKSQDDYDAIFAALRRLAHLEAVQDSPRENI